MIEKKKRCENCGKFPFCEYADKQPKEDCTLWVKREVEMKLIRKDNEGFTFKKI